MSEPTVQRERWNRWVIRLLLIIVIFTLVVLVSLIVYWVIRPTPFDPLAFEVVRVQEVAEDGNVLIPQADGFDAPSVYINQSVPLLFTICSNADDAFDAIGNSWFVDATHGEKYPLNQGLESTIRPGCITVRTDVEIPAQVRVDLLDFASGQGPSGEGSPWYIQGTLLPKESGGVKAHWQTEKFLIIAEPAPEG